MKLGGSFKEDGIQDVAVHIFFFFKFIFVDLFGIHFQNSGTHPKLVHPIQNNKVTKLLKGTNVPIKRYTISSFINLRRTVIESEELVLCVYSQGYCSL